MRIPSFFFLIPFLFVLSCNSSTEKVEEHFESDNIQPASDEIKEIIYSMYLPTDMADVFEQSGTNYDPDLPAPIDESTLFQEQEKIAIMLGVYGVDITYMKLLGQSGSASQYYKVIEQLSKSIGIPPSIFQRSSQRMEKYFNDEDSLASVIEDIYSQSDSYFKESGQDHLAALSLAGGWIEAMYIGSSILAADSGNYLLAERILQQKYSLNSIYTLLSNHQESLSIKGYLLLLKKLRNLYNEVEIRYQKEGFSVDTTQKKLQAYSANISYEANTMNQLLTAIPMIRKEFIRITPDNQ